MIRIATSAFCSLLTDLALTTAPEDGAHPHLAAILLYTDRGYPVADEPGKSDALVGLSTNRRVTGSAFTGCDGQCTPMLWPVDKARSVIGMFKPKTKINKDHAVILTRAGDHVTVQEDPNLFDDGDRFEFKLGDPDTFPAHALASTVDVMPLKTRQDPIPKPRTDFYPDDLATLCRIAKNRSTLVEIYRLHQDHRILVQIGPYWRGWVKPISYEVGEGTVGDGAFKPSGEVFYPDLVDNGLDVTGGQPVKPVPDEATLPLTDPDSGVVEPAGAL